MKNSKNFLLLLMVLTALVSCAPKDLKLLLKSGPCMASGDIVVSNSGTNAVLILNSDGTYKGTALELTSSAENIYGVFFDRLLN